MLQAALNFAAANPNATAILGLFVLSFGCRIVTSITPTPPAASRFAGLYTTLEWGGGAFGYAKDHGLITPTADETAAAAQALALGREVVSTIKATPAAVPVPQLAADTADTARAVVAALKEMGVLPPPPVSPAPPGATA